MFDEDVNNFPIFLVIIDREDSNFQDNVMADTENFKRYTSEKLKPNVDLDSLMLQEDRFIVADVDNILNRVVSGYKGNRAPIGAIKMHLAGLINLGNTCYMNSTL